MELEAVKLANPEPGIVSAGASRKQEETITTGYRVWE
jgi:hypothetical protein